MPYITGKIDPQDIMGLAGPSGMIAPLTSRFPVPKKNVLKHFAELTARLAPVIVPTKKQMVEVLKGLGIGKKEAGQMANEVGGIEVMGSRFVNKELVDNVGGSVKEVAKHERTHTATTPLVAFMKSVAGAKAFAPAAQTLADKTLNATKLTMLMRSNPVMVEKGRNEINAMLLKAGRVPASNATDTAQEVVNNMFIVYNSRNGKKILDESPIGTHFRDWFDEMLRTPHGDHPLPYTDFHTVSKGTKKLDQSLAERLAKIAGERDTAQALLRSKEKSK